MKYFNHKYFSEQQVADFFAQNGFIVHNLDMQDIGFINNWIETEIIEEKDGVKTQKEIDITKGKRQDFRSGVGEGRHEKPNLIVFAVTDFTCESIFDVLTGVHISLSKEFRQFLSSVVGPKYDKYAIKEGYTISCDEVDEK